MVGHLFHNNARCLSALENTPNAPYQKSPNLLKLHERYLEARNSKVDLHHVVLDKKDPLKGDLASSRQHQLEEIDDWTWQQWTWPNDNTNWIMTIPGEGVRKAVLLGYNHDPKRLKEFVKQMMRRQEAKMQYNLSMFGF